MKSILPFSFFCFLQTPALAQDHYLLVGTYNSQNSEGIYVYRFNSVKGTATYISHIKTPNPSFITISPDEKFVFAVHETRGSNNRGGELVSFAFNKQKGTLTYIGKQQSLGDHPCHVETDKTGTWLFGSNYSNGSLSVLRIQSGGHLDTPRIIQHSGSGKHPQRQQGPHTHGAIMSADNKQLFVTDLGIDKVLVYDFEQTSGKLSPSPQPFVLSPPGSGPRLLSFHPNNKFAYVIEELSGTVSVYRYKENQLSRAQRISTLPAGDTSFAGSADIHVSADGKFLYASNRGNVNSLAIFRIKKNGNLRLIGHQSTLGKTPRNFSIDPSGDFLLAANQNSDEIVIFKRNNKSGLLTDSGNRIKIGKPSCIQWITYK